MRPVSRLRFILPTFSNFSGKHRQQGKIPAAHAEAGKWIINDRVKTDGNKANTPDRSDSRAKAPAKDNQHNGREGNAPFGRPLQPIIMGAVDPSAIVIMSKHAVDRDVGFEAPAEERALANHFERGLVNGTADSQLIVLLQFLDENV